MRQFAIHPDRDLGQSCLIDSNILGVIERAAELTAGDVVLEIGGGLGVLSEYLAERVAHVHVVELDERLREAPPGKLVATLPYGIAAGALLRSIEQLPSLHSWVAMVQREVGERLAAAPRSGAYGTPPGGAPLGCEG